MLDLNLSTHRRGFLGSVAATAAAFGLGSVVPRRLLAEAPAGTSVDDPQLDAWLRKIKGKHKQVYDMSEFNGGLAFAWSRVFYMTNAETGVPETDIGVVVILRHGALPFAMNDAMWAKYKFGEVFHVNDPATSAPSVHNFFYKAPAGALPIPGMGIDELMATGTLFGACNMAIKFYSGIVGKQMNLKPEDVANDWRANLLPGVQVVPSGVWAVNRAQELGCTYCFAG
ncbi:MAG TPA: twin-arginine translocation signal domain-containing protein [Gemmatimonadales bacterium]|nr:twin-arginine translocation signal domain-containing protein [Gemmatimonadales bacterium]